MDYVIKTDFQGSGFVAVPNAVAQDAGLSAEALGVLVFLASQPRGFIARVVTIRQRFGMGKDKWQRIARELRDVGALSHELVRDAGGRLLAQQMVVSWPDVSRSVDLKPENPASGDADDLKPGNPAAGKTAKQSRKTRQTEPENPAPYKEQTKRKGRGRAKRASALRSNPAPLPCEGQGLALTLSDLGSFQRAQLRDNKPLVLRTGQTVATYATVYVKLAAQLASEQPVGGQSCAIREG